MLDGVLSFLLALAVPPLLLIVALVGAFVRTSVRWSLLIIPVVGTTLVAFYGHIEGGFRNNDAEILVYGQLAIMLMLLGRSVFKEARGDHQREW